MMDPFQGVFIEVTAEDEDLELYDDPDQDFDHDPLHDRYYIEAVTDAIFAIKVIFTKDFPLFTLQPHDAIRITISYDGNPVHWFNELTPHLMQMQWQSKGLVEHIF